MHSWRSIRVITQSNAVVEVIAYFREALIHVSTVSYSMHAPGRIRCYVWANEAALLHWACIRF